MTSRRASDGGGVLSFTFLDVLMCTMGSLLLLLVIFGVIAKQSTRARRAGEDAKLSLAALGATRVTTPPAIPGDLPPQADDATDPGALEKQLARVRREQVKLERLRAAASQRRREEQARIAHLEDHERRLEHDLGKLSIALHALDAAETKQVVDQQQADAEVERLKQLIDETENRLTEMRKHGVGDKSYALVPYKGANGTFRRPVFVECTADAVTIQPEGIRLTVADFDGPLRSGNPLAAAIRAAHEELNGRAAAAGQPDMPDPYPLLVVRPDGAAAYAAALDSIRSWDSDYGYEFVESDWKLKYPEPDPRLGQVMAHAVDEARQRQALLAKVAPRRYGSRLAMGGGGGAALDGDGGGDAAGFQMLGGGGGADRIGAHAGDGSLGGADNGAAPGNRRGGLNAGGRNGGGGNFIDEFAAADTATQNGRLAASGALGLSAGQGQGNGGGAGITDEANLRGGGPDADGNVPQNGLTPNGVARADSQRESRGNAAERGGAERGIANDAARGNGAGGGGRAASHSTAANGQGDSNPADGGGASGRAGGGAAGNASASGGGGMAGIQPIELNARRTSAADDRGANWANAEASRKASAITRPIKVVVRAEGLTVLDGDGQAAAGGAVTFQQPVDGVMDQLAAAVQQQTAEWGLAGDNMYWRPTLVVAVAPGAERQAQRLAELLDNSGVDMRLPPSTARAAEASGRATR